MARGSENTLRAKGVYHLRGPAGGVHKADGAGPDILGIQRAREQLVVRAVDGVAALECQHVHARRQRGAHLLRAALSHMQGACGQSACPLQRFLWGKSDPGPMRQTP